MMKTLLLFHLFQYSRGKKRKVDWYHQNASAIGHSKNNVHLWFTLPWKWFQQIWKRYSTKEERDATVGVYLNYYEFIPQTPNLFFIPHRIPVIFQYSSSLQYLESCSTKQCNHTRNGLQTTCSGFCGFV